MSAANSPSPLPVSPLLWVFPSCVVRFVDGGRRSCMRLDPLFFFRAEPFVEVEWRNVWRSRECRVHLLLVAFAYKNSTAALSLVVRRRARRPSPHVTPRLPSKNHTVYSCPPHHAPPLPRKAPLSPTSMCARLLLTPHIPLYTSTLCLRSSSTHPCSQHFQMRQVLSFDPVIIVSPS